MVDFLMAAVAAAVRQACDIGDSRRIKRGRLASNGVCIRRP